MDAPTGSDAERSFRHDWDGGFSAAIIDAVATVAGDDAVAGERLYDAVGPDALDRLFAPNGGSSRAVGTLTLLLSGCHVTALADGETRVAAQESSGSKPDSISR